MRLLALSFFFVAASLLPGAARAALANAPEKFQVGGITVWSIADAIGERDMSVFKADQETIKKYVPSGKSPSGVLALLIRTGDETILVDTGYGRDAGDTPSMLMPGLEAIGVKPGDITQVLITHMHGDHISGLVWKGEKAFPKATVLLGKQEHDFWTSEKSRAENPGRENNFVLAQKIVDMYSGSLGLFAFGDTVAPGVTALDAVGHTPGHTAFLIESDGEKLLCVADLLHSAALQFPRPDINASYDMDPEKAAATRERFLKMAAEENLPIVGMHMPFPGVARVTKASEGYAWTPGLK